MSDKITQNTPGLDDTKLQGRKLAALLEQGNSREVDRGLGLIQNSKDHGWKIAQDMKAAYDSDTLKKAGFPLLTIDQENNRVNFSLNTRDAHPITAFGETIDRLPLPGFLKSMFDGTRENHDNLNAWDANFGRKEAELVQSVGLNNLNQTTAFELYRTLSLDPARLGAVNAYLPRDRQLRIEPDLQSKSSCNGFNWKYTDGNQSARFTREDKEALCGMIDSRV
jgi:hypothetical protein